MSGFNVLFLCTHNSARSIMAEALFNHWAQGRMQAYSAGSQPRGRIHPMALRALAVRQIADNGLYSKAWDDFAVADAPRMNLVITVCDSAAGEMCPIWPGGPIKAHWGVEEPGSLAEGKPEAEALHIFTMVSEKLERRIQRFLALPLDGMDIATLRQELDQIGRMD